MTTAGAGRAGGGGEAHFRSFWLAPHSRDAAHRPQPPQPVAVPDGPLKDVLRYVPENVAVDLSAHQIAVLNEAMTRRRRIKNHAFDYRGRVRWFGKRYYVAFLAGPETRIIVGGKPVLTPRRMIIKVGNCVGLYVLVAATAFPVVLFLYFLKSLAGIDLFDGPSLLHDFIFWK